MAELRQYTVVINGHETIMNLSEEDARRLGGTPVESKQRTSTSTKRRTVRNKSSDSDDAG
ncbi:MAG: hypothetical protein GEU83_11875 [Pseudonocardiaceae bacterium]|nr:hypothetical protein [Pseudonocardiaceae bacterium]